jgi:hypothetical protein
MTRDEVAARGRRLWCLLTLLAVIIVPTTLRIFFIADTSQLSYHWENRHGSLEADNFFLNDYAHSVDGEIDARSNLSNRMMKTKVYRRKIRDYFSIINTDHYELSRMLISEPIEDQVNRKRCIHAIVTTAITLIIPSIVFLYAFIFLKKTHSSDRSTNKLMRRKERILRGLVECRIHLPTSNITEDINTTDQDKQRECPICLSAFTKGEAVIASKYCYCNIRIGSNHGTNRTATVADNSIKPQNHRSCFHENCIFTWLSHRKSNPKKLCPCCRQPFLSSKQR